jgi:RepB plasmid partitioning protein/ParB-like nuclease family protein
MAKHNRVTMAFEPKGIRIALTDILPVKQLGASTKTARKYKQIAASIREIGLIEPLVVIRQKGHRGAYLLLDGHVRLQILKDFGTLDTMCLIATDDEAFTYNKRISRLATIQEHKMILKAIESGVPEERIAKALDINVALIRRKRRLLDGICPEVADLLKDRHCPIDTFRSLKQLKPIRQMEVAQLMVTMNNYSTPYSRALLAATPVDQLVDATKPKIAKGVSPEQMARMEVEMDSLQREMKQVEASYGEDQLNLVISGAYIASLLRNEQVVQHLDLHHAEILNEFRRITDTANDTAAGLDEDDLPVTEQV